MNLNINNLNIDDLNINSIEIITLPKVASSSFEKTLEKKYKTNHCHSLEHLNNIINNSNNTLIISGVRNPIDEIISLFFYGYDKIYLKEQSTIRYKKNNYKGQKLYFNNTNTLLNNSLDILKNEFFGKIKTNGECNLNLFNDWMEEYLEITKITEFNKNIGYQLYKLHNNNYVFLYRFENIITGNIFTSFFNLPFSHHKNTNDMEYKNKIIEFKNNIKFNMNQINTFFNTKYVKMFYTDDEIYTFYKKYLV
tara:strand:- start:6235 stop:6987 length:753 start_codon:yes stop_codon:yes gene_type:complete